MLKFQNTAKVGDSIRAYDFAPKFGVGDCFLEGTVIDRTREKGYDAYKVLVTADSWDGSQLGSGSRVGSIAYVPFQVSFMEFDERVVNLTEEMELV